MSKAVPRKTHMPSRLGTKGLLGIGPYIAIARKFDAEFCHWLPNQQHYAVLWSIDIHPYHGLVIVSDGWRRQEAVNNCREWYLSAGRKVMGGNEVYMFQLFPSAIRANLSLVS